MKHFLKTDDYEATGPIFSSGSKINLFTFQRLVHSRTSPTVLQPASTECNHCCTRPTVSGLADCSKNCTCLHQKNTQLAEKQMEHA